MRILVTIISILLISCSSNESNKQAGNLEQTRTPSEFEIKPETKKTDSLRNPYHPSYLTDIPLRIIGDLVLTDSIQASDNEVTFQLLDSINSKLKSTRDYYYPIFKHIAAKSDGALSEAIGAYAMEYVSKYPHEFFDRYQCCESSKECCDQLIRISRFIQFEIGMQPDVVSSYNSFLGTIETDNIPSPEDYLRILFVDNLTNGMDQYLEE